MHENKLICYLSDDLGNVQTMIGDRPGIDFKTLFSLQFLQKLVQC